MNVAPKTDNYTLYGIHSQGERSLLAAYCSFIIFSSLVGDLLILVGSSEQFHAIKLHKILVVFIKNISVTNIFISVLRVIPCAVSLVADRWVFGNAFCLASFFVSMTMVAAHFSLMSGLALAKLLIVMFPLKAIAWPLRGANITTALIWTFWTGMSLLVAVFSFSGVYFSYYSYNCEQDWSTSFRATAWFEVFHVTLAIVLLTLSAVTLVSSVILIVLAKRTAAQGAGRLQWRGVLTVFVTVGVYVLSVLPIAIYFFVSIIVGFKGNVAQLQFFLYRFGSFFGLVSTISNFYIFSVAMPSFRQFLKTRAKKIDSFLSLRFPARQPESTSSKSRD